MYSDRLFSFSVKFCITSLDRIILNLGINYTIGVAQLDCLLGFYGTTNLPTTARRLQYTNKMCGLCWLKFSQKKTELFVPFSVLTGPFIQKQIRF